MGTGRFRCISDSIRVAEFWVPSLALEEQRAAESDGCRQFRRSYRGHGVFLSEQYNVTNRLHPNPN